jgi:hypothetical protein
MLKVSSGTSILAVEDMNAGVSDKSSFTNPCTIEIANHARRLNLKVDEGERSL